MKKALITIALLTAVGAARAQEHEMKDNYVWPTDQVVLKKLSHWQGLKFGLMMHWGTYSQWGVVESWSICPEDEGWTQRHGPYSANYNEYVNAYEGLQKSFNPTAFDPDKWARAAKEAGMKYVVFTTKHHDGFAMFDSKQTDYKITSPSTAFSTHPKSNVAKEIFNSFRKYNMLIGAYFSKPDWNNKDYWWPYFPARDRNVNYDPKKYPERWKAFKDFTYNQLEELMTDYGKMDVLWLDGGWVRPLSSVDPKVSWQHEIKNEQDVDIKRIATMARTHQPGLLVVDRSVGGEFENYQTPEQMIPDKPLDFPWESCITMGNSWSYVKGDTYKSSKDLVQMLIKIVSRGGNLLLNVGPSPEGDWDPIAYSRLQDIGKWMNVNSSAIYASKPIAPYEENNLVYTQSEDGKTKYVFVLAPKDGDRVNLPAQLKIHRNLLTTKSTISVLGTKSSVNKIDTSTGIISFDKELQVNGTDYAIVFKIYTIEGADSKELTETSKTDSSN